MDNYPGNCCGRCSGSNYYNVYSSYSCPVHQSKIICLAAPSAKAKPGERKGPANGKKIVTLASPISTPKAAASCKKQEIVKVSGCSIVKNVYSCSNPTRAMTKVSAALVKKEAKGSKVGVVTTYTSMSKVVVSVEKQEIVKVSGCSKVKNVYLCSNPTRAKTKVSAAVVKKEAKGCKVGVVATYTSTSKVVVSVEKQDTVKVIAGFLGF